MVLKDEERFTDRKPVGPMDHDGSARSRGVVDHDTRRLVVVHMEAFDTTETVGLQRLRKHMDSLGPAVVAIRTNANNDLLATMTAKQDEEWIDHVKYPTVDQVMAHAPYHIPTVVRSDLIELDRLSIGVDAVCYQDQPARPGRRRVVPSREASRRVAYAASIERMRRLRRRARRGANMNKSAFKYEYQASFHMFWQELTLLMNLPAHPNIIPIERLVIDEIHHRVVGFTTVFLPGGTIEDNVTRTFKIAWLQQLMDVVDVLNLQYGIVHQDIFPRNLLISNMQDRIMLFDFNWASRIGKSCRGDQLIDVKGVIFALYKIITRDPSTVERGLEDADTTSVERMATWAKHKDVNLDRGVGEFRALLDKWVAARRAILPVTSYKDAPQFVEIPDCPSNSSGTVPMFLARQQRLPIVEWARPAQCRLTKNSCLLANGRLI